MTTWPLKKMVEDFKNLDALYIADGHHRSAAASRVHASRAHNDARSSLHREEGFLCVIFPHDELQILPYNRVVRDLNGHTPQKISRGLGLGL